LLPLALFSCTSGLATDFDGGLLPVGSSRDCPAGFVARGAVCDAVLPADKCPAGTMPVIGSTTCAKVGHITCGPGLTPEPSGWGCTEVMPATRCTGATMEVLGSPLCQNIGDCNAPFPPANATLFVGFDAGLDATHFATLTDALAAAPDGGVIALEAGSYFEELTVTRSVSVIGRCAQKVLLQSPAGPQVPGFDIKGGDVTLSGMTLTQYFNGILVRPDAGVHIDHCVLSQNEITGINATGAALDLSDTVIRESLRDSSTGDWGIGLEATGGSTVKAHRISISHNIKAGIDVEDKGTQVVLDAVVVRDTLAGVGGKNGDGIVAFDGPVVTMTGSAIVNNVEAGLSIEGPTTLVTFTIDQSVIRDTQPRPVPGVDPMNPANKQWFGSNIEAQAKVSVTMTNTSLLRSAGESMLVFVAPAQATISDSTLYSTLLNPDHYPQAGLLLQNGSQVSMLRSAIAEVQGASVQSQFGNHLSMVGCVIADSLATGTPPFGQGMQVEYDGGVVLSGSAITGSDGVGILLGGKSTLNVDTTVIGWGGQFPDGGQGRGIDAIGGSTLVMSTSAVVQSGDVGVIVAEPGTFAQITGSVVRDSKGSANGLAGRGINVQQSGTLALSDSLVANNHDVGLLVGNVGSSAVVDHSVITNTLPRAFDGHFGVGVLSLVSGRVDLKSTEVSQSGAIAIAVDNAAATVSACTIANNPVALQVQDGSMLQEVQSIPMTVGPTDVLVTDDTVFSNNATRVGTGSVPLPEAQ
jgi:hypothetical protein